MVCEELDRDDVDDRGCVRNVGNADPIVEDLVVFGSDSDDVCAAGFELDCV